MRLLIQRVSRAKVSVEERVTAEIGPGLLIFLGIGFDDSESICAEMAGKASRLRIFADESGKMNLDIMQVSGEVIVVSQFTLYGNTRKGNRPNFTNAAEPSKAKMLYDKFVLDLKKILGENRLKEGVFGEMMQVELLNNGPVTIWIESC